jgi:hypothetical protein
MSNAVAVVACALSLLGRSPRTLPPIVLVDEVPIEASSQVEGFVRPFDGTIYLVTTSPVFRLALSSRYDCDTSNAMRKLASVIAHEEWHIRHGSEERGAYEAQLTTLLRIGVPPDSTLYTSVVRSMLAVLKKRNQKPDMVLAGRPDEPRD